ncbi:MAG: heat-inducible transcriptional repressor HrcA [Actinobacteria bacterium]|uniref:Unannotated protein n=1 Tax=freshwater metagenome TaxID=449393 RepID=A0A6J7FUC4_9ZZZZ|nr:heat-inducible transcriptional repressor HrcA [Actinomycetota bacterium]
MVSQRGLDVLRVIVQDYVSLREPVGSKSIADRHSFGVSAATIRNDMSLLEDEHLITAPHTSSGRIPTDKGYRVFVDNLDDIRSLSVAQRSAIERVLEESDDIDALLAHTVRLLAQLTNQVAVVEYPSLGGARVKHIELVGLGNKRVMSVLITDNGRVEQRTIETDRELSELEIATLRTHINAAVAGQKLGEVTEALAQAPAVAPELSVTSMRLVATLAEQVAANRQQRLVMAGAGNLVRTENDFQGSIYPLLDAIEEQVTVLKLLAEMASDESEVSVSIGREHDVRDFREASLVAGGYSSSGEVSRLGVIGPTRMDYSGNMAAVRAVAHYLSRILDS